MVSFTWGFALRASPQAITGRAFSPEHASTSGAGCAFTQYAFNRNPAIQRADYAKYSLGLGRQGNGDKGMSCVAVARELRAACIES